MAARGGNRKLNHGRWEAHLLFTLSKAFFVIQQPLFAPDSGTEADQLAVAADYPMTGDDNRDGVFVVGIAHGAKGLRATDGPGNISV